jgi:type IV pilus assembly protein PilB
MERTTTMWKDIGTLLMEYGLINNDDLKEGLKYQKKTGLRLGEALAELGIVSMEDIDWILSKQLNIPYVIVEDVAANSELLNKFQKKFLIENRILPLFETEYQISIATEDPFNEPAIGFIEDYLGKTVNVSTGSGRKIEELLQAASKRVGIPELVTVIENIIEKIKESSFYRIDFLLDELQCKINVFGCGILREIVTIKGAFGKEDILRTFISLNIRFLYDYSFNSKRTYLAIYPLANEIETVNLPAIVGNYGLCLAGDVTFSDAYVYETPLYFHSGNPVHGYHYFSTKGNDFDYVKSIYTIDAAPSEFEDYYLNVYIPKKCPSCTGTGCQNCKDLGYEFIKMEGVYSSDYLNKVLKEG